MFKKIFVLVICAITILFLVFEKKQIEGIKKFDYYTTKDLKTIKEGLPRMEKLDIIWLRHKTMPTSYHDTVILKQSNFNTVLITFRPWFRIVTYQFNFLISGQLKLFLKDDKDKKMTLVTFNDKGELKSICFSDLQKDRKTYYTTCNEYNEFGELTNGGKP